MLQIAFGDTYMSHSKIYEWYSRFKNGRTSVEDDPRAGRPSTSTTKEKKEEIEALLQENHRSTIRKLSEEVGISIGQLDQQQQRNLPSMILNDTVSAAFRLMNELMMMN
ncbi:PREDICTED: putative uncharacterized protein FLJ37770 [Habropoda laboriosa]|uniref:putative uncharacterized protein FLJ37770 n=1 Tax=Habropoda laboriosa TaxID=597456 RepID=UPI00083D5470|nr:PREDICTED: putative uncharacterized protein FLJ37770 [Habropoda laboriosa]